MNINLEGTQMQWPRFPLCHFAHRNSPVTWHVLFPASVFWTWVKETITTSAQFPSPWIKFSYVYTWDFSSQGNEMGENIIKEGGKGNCCASSPAIRSLRKPLAFYYSIVFSQRTNTTFQQQEEYNHYESQMEGGEEELGKAQSALERKSTFWFCLVQPIT